MKRMVTGRRTFVSAAGLLLTGMRTHAWAQAKPELASLSIGVGSRAAMDCLPLTVAERLGYFESEGLEVELREHGGGALALQAVLDGKDDVVAGPFSQTIGLQSRSQFFRAFVLICRAPQVAMGVSTRTMPGYRVLANLKGRKVGVGMAGSGAETVAGMVLTGAGLSLQDVNFVELGSVSAGLASVRAGKLDAISFGEPLMTMLEHKSDVRVVSDTRTLKGTQQLFGGLMPATCLHAPDEFVQKHPRTVQALANAIVHALKWLQTAGPSDIIKTVPDPYMFGDRSLYLASFNKAREAIAVDGLIADEGPRTALRAMGRLNADIHPARIELSRTYTNEFAKKAKEKFRA